MKRPTTGDFWQKTYGCSVYSNVRISPHGSEAHYLRYPAGGVFLVTLAALPALGAGRRRTPDARSVL